MTRFHSGAIRNIQRAPYADQVAVILLDRGLGMPTEAEFQKIERVRKFLRPVDCAREIEEARERRSKANR
jgi:hypothetical protein